MSGAFDEADWVDRFDRNFLGGGDDFCSVGDGEIAGDDPFENRFSEKKKIEKYFEFFVLSILKRVNSGVKILLSTIIITMVCDLSDGKHFKK